LCCRVAMWALINFATFVYVANILETGTFSALLIMPSVCRMCRSSQQQILNRHAYTLRHDGGVSTWNVRMAMDPGRAGLVDCGGDCPADCPADVTMLSCYNGFAFWLCYSRIQTWLRQWWERTRASCHILSQSPCMMRKKKGRRQVRIGGSSGGSFPALNHHLQLHRPWTTLEPPWLDLTALPQQHRRQQAAQAQHLHTLCHLCRRNRICIQP
jgi:hypothetical protein